MQSYYKQINFIKDSLNADIDINTITHGGVNDVDIEKKNIFPLAHIEIQGASFPQGMVQLNWKISVLDIRQESKTPAADKFLRNDNETDIMNTMLSVINRFIFTLKSQANDLDIEILNEPAPIPIEYQFQNKLDGWEVEIQLGSTNTIDVCND